MKKLCFILLFSVMIYGCSSELKDDYNSNLYGKWILVNVSGGIAGDINEIDTKTERHLIVFDKNNSVSFYHNDSLLNNNNFYIEKRKSIYSTEELDFIIYENNMGFEVISYLSKDTLVISDNNYDGFTKIYTRQDL